MHDLADRNMCDPPGSTVEETANMTTINNTVMELELKNCRENALHIQQIQLELVQLSENNQLMLLQRLQKRSSCDPLEPLGIAVKKFFVWKIFLVFTFLMALFSIAVSLINSVQQNANNNNNNNK